MAVRAGSVQTSGERRGVNRLKRRCGTNASPRKDPAHVARTVKITDPARKLEFFARESMICEPKQDYWAIKGDRAVDNEEGNKEMQQTQIISTRDPITGRDIEDLASSPFLVEVDEGNELIIYFESEESRSAYLNLPVERPGTDFRVNLDNPTEDCFDGN